ncbi:MAG: toprim domain-containing protein [Candidatus Hydrogenedentes bacterium]|nr:toprim domain-containing protein [Candidatus Hydrogenedentota bacterium]
MTAHEITTALGGQWHGSYGMVQCPAHDDGCTPGLKITDDDRKDDGIDVHCFAGCDWRQVKSAFRQSGLLPDFSRSNLSSDRTSPYQKANLKPPAADKRRQAAKGMAIWQESEAITGTLAEAYLQDRCITTALPPSLRFHPALPYWDTAGDKPVLLGDFPTLVSGITVWPSRSVVAVQAVYLNPKTAGKADVGCPKKTFGPAAGGAVRLAAHGLRLALCEGVETGLSVLQSCNGLPVWATTGTAGLYNVTLPPIVTDLIIAADADPPGEIAAQKSSQRFIAEGRRVKVAKPPHGHNDFNDALVSQEAAQPGKATIHV